MMRKPQMVALPLTGEEKAWLEEARAARGLGKYKRNPSLGKPFVRPAEIVTPAPNRIAPVRYKQRCSKCRRQVCSTAEPAEGFECQRCTMGGPKKCPGCKLPLPADAHPLKKWCQTCTKIRDAEAVSKRKKERKAEAQKARMAMFTNSQENQA